MANASILLCLEVARKSNPARPLSFNTVSAAARSEGERAHVATAALRSELYPEEVPARVFVTHTRPEPLLGTLQPLNAGERTAGLGFVNHSGTLNVAGLLFVNRCSWAHVLVEAARVMDLPREGVLTPEELTALDGKASPEGVIV